MSRVLFGIFNHHRNEITEELLVGTKYQEVPIDILIVVHNQVDYLKKCVESIFQHTTNFKLYIWDNGSDEETKLYLNSLLDVAEQIVIVTSEANSGFIKPNNSLASMGSNPYLVLLNSDTEVMQGWKEPLVAWLQGHPNIAATGYQGCKLDENFKGGLISFGNDVDYISGWCLCLPRKIYDEVGLFDEEHLEFAYAEDCDFSLRLQEQGYQIYAFHMTRVAHHENKTILAVAKDRPQWLQEHFDKNHDYLRRRWADFFARQKAKFTVGENGV